MDVALSTMVFVMLGRLTLPVARPLGLISIPKGQGLPIALLIGIWLTSVATVIEFTNAVPLGTAQIGPVFLA